MNPVEIVSAIKKGQNPQQIMLSLLEERAASTPMGDNLITLIKENRTNEIEQIARNAAQARGLDYDKEFQAFKKRLGL